MESMESTNNKSTTELFNMWKQKYVNVPDNNKIIDNTEQKVSDIQLSSKQKQVYKGDHVFVNPPDEVLNYMLDTKNNYIFEKISPNKKVENVKKDEKFKKVENIEKKINKEEPIKITTEGFTQNEYSKNKSLLKTKLSQCNWCAKYYQKSILLTDELSPGGYVCKHCMFTVNYDETNRLQFDTSCIKKKTSIASYILECKDDHDTYKCARYPQCYVCDYKLLKPIKNILNASSLDLDENGVRIIKTEDTDNNDVIFNEHMLLKMKIPSEIKI
jgi:hypothetical protein